jgi:hypothetical protein
MPSTHEILREHGRRLAYRKCLLHKSIDATRQPLFEPSSGCKQKACAVCKSCYDKHYALYNDRRSNANKKSRCAGCKSHLGPVPPFPDASVFKERQRRLLKEHQYVPSILFSSSFLLFYRLESIDRCVYGLKCSIPLVFFAFVFFLLIRLNQEKVWRLTSGSRIYVHVPSQAGE